MSTRPLLTRPSFLIGTGILTGVVVVAAISVSLKWAALIGIAVCGLLPTLVIRPIQYYLLPCYFVLITIEVLGKSIDKYFVDGALLLEVYGTPPSGEVGIFIYPSDIILLVLVVLWLIPVISGRTEIEFHRFGYVFLLWLGWIALVSVIKSDIIFLSIAELLRQTKFFVVYLYAANCMKSRKFFRWFLFILLGCLFIQSGVTLAAFFSGHEGHPMSFLLGGASSAGSVSGYDLDTVIDEDSMSGTRAGGTFGNPIQTAIYLEFLIPLAFVMFWMERSLMLRLIAGALFAVGFVAFYFTLSRAALASLTVGMGLCLLMLYWRKEIPLKATLLIICCSVLLAGPAAYYFVDNMSKRPTNLLGRFVIMEKATVMIIENPVLGVGLNNNTAVKRKMFRPDPRYPGEETFPVHNHYLVVLSETGILGFFLQMYLLYLVISQAWKLTRSDDRMVRMFGIASVATFVALYINLAGDHFSGNAQRSFYFFFAGLVMALQGGLRDDTPAGQAAPSESAPTPHQSFGPVVTQKKH